MKEDINKERNWLSVAGQADSVLQDKLSRNVAAKIASGEYSQKDIDYVFKLKRPLAAGRLNIADSKLEKLRTLCQIWDVKIQPVKISSHRKVIGPLIVAVKKLIHPILKVLLKDFVRQQRDFNAATISLLAELCDENSNSSSNLRKAK